LHRERGGYSPAKREKKGEEGLLRKATVLPGLWQGKENGGRGIDEKKRRADLHRFDKGEAGGDATLFEREKGVARYLQGRCNALKEKKKKASTPPTRLLENVPLDAL